MQWRYKSQQDIFWETWQSDSKMHLDEWMGEESQEKNIKEGNKVSLWYI